MKIRDLPLSLRAKARKQMPPRQPKTQAERDLEKARAELARGQFFAALDRWNLPRPEYEGRFHHVRRWRFDYLWPDRKLALEVDGGLFTGGAHVQGARIRKTHQKLNMAAALGWRVMVTTPDDLTTPGLLALLRRALEN